MNDKLDELLCNIDINQIVNIITDLKLMEIKALELYGDKLNEVLNEVFIIDGVEYIPNEVNQYGYVSMSSVIYRLNSGEFICGGMGNIIHIDELLKMKTEDCE